MYIFNNILPTTPIKYVDKNFIHVLYWFYYLTSRQIQEYCKFMKDGEIEAEKQRILKQFRLGITEYYMALDNLQADMPGFNLDVATDIHPHLADYTSPAGHEQLKTWQNLYAQLEEKPRYTVVRRYSTQRNSYHGLATGLEVSVAHAWLEVYEDLTPDDISFEHDKETGEKFVSINKFANATHTEGSNEPTRLYSTDVPRSIFNNNETLAHARRSRASAMSW